MSKGTGAACFRPSPLSVSVSVLAFALQLGEPSSVASAQGAGIIDPTQTRDWVPGAIGHAQRMRTYKDVDQGAQPTPPIIPKLAVDDDPSGRLGSFQPNGATITSNNPFFQNLGSNGRTCFTCHQPQNGWTISAKHVRDRFHSDSNDPLFRLVDGATCPSAVSTRRATRKACLSGSGCGCLRRDCSSKSSRS